MNLKIVCIAGKTGGIFALNGFQYIIKIISKNYLCFTKLLVFPSF